MTVFAVHETKDDISPARNFGDVRYVNKFYIHGDELEPVPDNTSDLTIPRGYAANIDRAVDAFDPASDYLLISGDHLQLLAMTAVLAGRFGSFNVLRWDRQARSYIPIRLHSGLVPPPVGVLASDTPARSGDADNIGEMTHEDRIKEARRLYLDSERILNEIAHGGDLPLAPVRPKRTS